MTYCKFGLWFDVELQILSPYKSLTHLKIMCSVQTQAGFLLLKMLTLSFPSLEEKKVNKIV